MCNPKTCCIFASSNKEVNGLTPHQSNPKQKQNDMEKETKITKSIAGLIELRDDDTETGGISFRGETLADFIEETDLGYGHSLDEVNKALKECGIMPIGEDEIPSPYKIIFEEVLYKGGYIRIPKENRQEFVMSDDDEGNDYHGLYCEPMTDPKEVRQYMQYSCSGLMNCPEPEKAIIL